jgi:hypothetical protein
MLSDYDKNNMVWGPDASQVIIPGFFVPPSITVPPQFQDTVATGDERWIGGKKQQFNLKFCKLLFKVFIYI